MKRGWQRTGGIGLCVAMLGAIGCANPKDEQIANLQRENAALADELSAARMQLSATGQDAEEARRRAGDLQSEVDRLRSLAATASASAPPASQTEGWQAVPGGARIALPGSVLFDPGKAVVKDSGKRVLNTLVSDLKGTYSDKEIFVFGHTDNNPIRKSGWKDNWELSAERSLAVVRYLREHGIPGARLVAAGCGEYRPAGSNSSAAGQAKNRRVEIYAISPGR